MNATVVDVAAYFLAESGTRMTTMKLQKLCYYGQAWSLVWDRKKLFDAPIFAWANGPVAPELFKLHRGKYFIEPGALDKYGADFNKLTQEQMDTCNAVIDSYGKFSGTQLSFLTHNEEPWLQARGGLGPHEKGNEEITTDAMLEFYTLQDEDENAKFVTDFEFPKWIV